MTKLNLVYPEKSDIRYKVSKFPDGQQTIDVEANQVRAISPHIKLSARLNNFKDLELIICATQALRNCRKDVLISLYVPYFMGARSDRKFQEGGVNYLKQVICPIINSLKFNRVLVVDPHSDVLEACLDNFKKVNNHSLVQWALTDIDNKDNAQDRVVLVSPDAGAYKKIFDVAQKFKIENVITASKVRDIKTGNILRTEVPYINDYLRHKFVIIDDICDGGRTFLEIAKVIKEQQPDAEIYLIVTHGIFSKSFLALSKYFTKIYSTNSYSDIDVESHSDYTVDKSFFEQFRVF